MVAPDLYPIDPEVPIDRRTQHKVTSTATAGFPHAGRRQLAA